MEEKLEEVVEETTQETTEKTEETPQIDESKFDSAGDDSVIKVDLSKPLKPIEENVQSTDNTETEEVQEEIIKEAERRDNENRPYC